MPEPDRLLGMYLHLARASTLRQQPLVRDKMLILAGVQAQEMGLDPISALCRQKVLASNARHLVGQWPTFHEALADDNFHTYLKQLRRRFSAEKVEHILHSLGIELGRERDAYFTDLEYAAALLDTRPESIAGLLSSATEPNNLAETGAASKGTRAGGDEPQLLAGQLRARETWLVWGPWLAGLTIVGVLSLASRLLMR